MQHPGIGGDTALQGQHQVVESVEPTGSKGVDVLMVVVDGSDEHAGHYQRDDAGEADQRCRQGPEGQAQRENRQCVGDGTAVGLVLQDGAQAIWAGGDANASYDDPRLLNRFQVEVS